MTLSARRVWLRVGLVLAMCIGGFLAFQQPVRELESHAVAAILRFFGAEQTQVVLLTNVAIFTNQGWLLASITPSCSTLASVLAIGCLASVAPLGDVRRRVSAASVALLIITIGNLGRMAASLGLGIVAGQDALVLFHDWVGGLCTFTYTLMGYVLFIYLMLPSRRPPRRRPAPAHGAPALD